MNPKQVDLISSYYVWYAFTSKEKALENFSGDIVDVYPNLKRHACFGSYVYRSGSPYFVSTPMLSKFVPVAEHCVDDFSNVSISVVEEKKGYLMRRRGTYGIDTFLSTTNELFKDGDRYINDFSLPLFQIELSDVYSDLAKELLYYVMGVLIRVPSYNEYITPSKAEPSGDHLGDLIRWSNERYTDSHSLYNDILEKEKFLKIDDYERVNQRALAIGDNWLSRRQTSIIKTITAENAPRPLAIANYEVRKEIGIGTIKVLIRTFSKLSSAKKSVKLRKYHHPEERYCITYRPDGRVVYQL